MIDFSSHQILIFLAGTGLMGFGVVALVASYLWPRKQTPVPVPVPLDATAGGSAKGGIVVSVVPPASSALLSTSAGGTLLVSRREAFTKGEEAAPVEAAPIATETPVLASEEAPAAGGSFVAKEEPEAPTTVDLSLLEDLYAEMFALRSSIGELSRDIDTLRVRLEQSIEPARAPSKRRGRSPNLQVQAAA